MASEQWVVRHVHHRVQAMQHAGAYNGRTASALCQLQQAKDMASANFDTKGCSLQWLHRATVTRYHVNIDCSASSGMNGTHVHVPCQYETIPSNLRTATLQVNLPRQGQQFQCNGHAMAL